MIENHQHWQLSLQTPERKRALKLTADGRWDQLGMERCREGRRGEERQEGGGARSAVRPLPIKLNLYFSHAGEKINCTPLKKIEKQRSGRVRGGVGGGVRIVYM